eukprot:359159-Chlamydomonas_euryale.AAC.25
MLKSFNDGCRTRPAAPSATGAAGRFSCSCCCCCCCCSLPEAPDMGGCCEASAALCSRLPPRRRCSSPNIAACTSLSIGTADSAAATGAGQGTAAQAAG